MVNQQKRVEQESAYSAVVICIPVLVYRARPSLPRMMLLSHALNYKRVWRGGREGLAEVISIHEALTNQIAVQNPCHGSHLGASIYSIAKLLSSGCYENKL